jgi:Xaa-Pro aminopeptidase
MVSSAAEGWSMGPFEPAVYAERRAALYERMRDQGIDVLFCPPSGDLEYLTGARRRFPTFGNISYTHGWVCGAFLRPGHDPVMVLPRMVAEFDMPAGVPGDVVVVNETDDGAAVFERLVRGFGPIGTIAVEQRTWAETVLALGAASGAKIVSSVGLTNPMRRIKSAAEIELMSSACRLADSAMAAVTADVADGAVERDLVEELDSLLHREGSRGVSFDTAVWAMGPSTDRDASDRETSARMSRSSGVSFDFGAVIGGYCSDFGRTVAIGDTSPEFVRVYEVVIAAQAAGLAAVRPGVPAREVDAACRQVITEAGYGDWFRHRTGHCIGLDVHEYPFISEEDETPLETGMTFTIEPSVFWPGRVGVRIEDIVLVTPDGGVKLNQYSPEMVVVDGSPSLGRSPVADAAPCSTDAGGYQD